jgi:murein DD-endopeptidase MepM/ murein hydrolase activator NlpD
VELQRRLVEGKVEPTLWDALTAADVNLEAVSLMEDALQSAVDFSQTRKHDTFKLLYDEKFIAGKSIGAGKVYAAYYQREGRESYVFWFDDGTNRGYFDQEGRPTKKAFLRAPLKYSRISSRFNPARFHPVLKKVRPHLGTDYAAPHGTPIYSVGDGVVVEAAYTTNNGRYVKIRHDNVYQTQYLHMSGFAKGIKPGTTVSQGDVIGYVGSTGLATGPHVCFRFWKNGRQVNHLKENLPSVKQLPQEALEAFFEIRDHYLRILDGSIPPHADPTVVAVETAAQVGPARSELP